jgi:hypothetical protein
MKANVLLVLPAGDGRRVGRQVGRIDVGWNQIKQGILKGEVSLYRWPPV